MGTRSGLPRNRIFLEYQIDVYITGSPESIVKCSNVVPRVSTLTWGLLSPYVLAVHGW